MALLNVNLVKDFTTASQLLRGNAKLEEGTQFGIRNRVQQRVTNNNETLIKAKIIIPNTISMPNNIIEPKTSAKEELRVIILITSVSITIGIISATKITINLESIITTMLKK